MCVKLPQFPHIPVENSVGIVENLAKQPYFANCKQVFLWKTFLRGKNTLTFLFLQNFNYFIVLSNFSLYFSRTLSFTPSQIKPSFSRSCE